MGSPVELQLRQRAPKKPVRNLPSSIKVPGSTTVEEIKKRIAKDVGIRDYNRIGLFYSGSGKTLKDRLAKIEDEKDVIDTGEVLVKDLGPQASWRLVFFIEYIGPLLIQPLILLIRSFIYPNLVVWPLAAEVDTSAGLWASLSPSQQLYFGMIMAHFVKRELETVFVHRFSAATMPAALIVRNSAFYWLLAGLVSALDVYHPNSPAAKKGDPLLWYTNAAGLALYIFGQVMNATVHLHLAGLRSPGSTERKIPRGYGFGLVTCPNYMYEVIAWLGMVVVSRSWAVALTIAIGTSAMRPWAKNKERNYRLQFGDKYKKKKWTMLPGFF